MLDHLLARQGEEAVAWGQELHRWGRAELLATNKALQAVALEQGFRTGDTAAFADAAQKAGLAVDVKLNQVIDPPGFDLMFEMIDIVSREMNQ